MKWVIEQMLKLTELDRILIQKLQGEIPLCEEPYAVIARQAGVEKSEVLKRLKFLQDKGVLRRIACLLNHRDSGYKANGMFVCKVSPDRIEEVALALICLQQVSHCYQRKTYQEWPYNLYAMIHSQSYQEVKEFVASFVKEENIDEYKLLFSTEEIKKTSMKYEELPDPEN